MKLNTVFSSFCESLHKRKELMTEDNIRYYWFASMLKEDPDLEHYTMEYPYDTKVFEQTKNRAKKELDFLYLNGDESYCMEIKFHRNPDPRATFAHTDAAGSLFNDIIRLALFEPGKAFEGQTNQCSLPKNTRRLFLYVTDEEMNDYLGKSSNYPCNLDFRKELKKFYRMEPINTFQSIQFTDTPETFKNTALDTLDKNKYNLTTIPPIRLLHQDTCLTMQSKSFAGHQCHVRIYEVKQAI